jgi:hypothetical protein
MPDVLEKGSISREPGFFGQETNFPLFFESHLVNDKALAGGKMFFCSCVFFFFEKPTLFLADDTSYK